MATTGAKRTTNKRKSVDEKIRRLHEQSRLVPVTSLKAHPQNPNIGDLDAIKASLTEFGQYRPIVVNRRNGMVVAGHHTWLAARELGWDVVSVVEVDVDEETHLRMMIADNRTSDLRQTDEALLDNILQQISSYEGTGFTELDVEDLHTRVQQLLSEGETAVRTLVHEQRKAELELRRSKTFDGSPLGEEPDDPEEFDDPVLDSLDDDEGDSKKAAGRVTERRKEDDPIQDAAETLNGGLVQFRPPDDLSFPGVGELEIPRVDTNPDKLMHFDEIPENLLAWAGSATKDWPNPDQWWLYNWGVDSTAGMKDVSKVVVAFYTHDPYFENWWWYPDRYAAKVVNSGIRYIISPDYSMDTDQPRTVALWQLYRNRWLARYFQEIGLKMMPNVSWKDGDELFLRKYVIETLPKGLPCIAMQVQTIDFDNVVGGIETYRRHVQMVLDKLEPQGVLLYTGKQTDAALEGVRFDMPVFRVTSRLDALSERAKQRKRKKTI